MLIDCAFYSAEKVRHLYFCLAREHLLIVQRQRELRRRGSIRRSIHCSPGGIRHSLDRLRRSRNYSRGSNDCSRRIRGGGSPNVRRRRRTCLPGRGRRPPRKPAGLPVRFHRIS